MWSAQSALCDAEQSITVNCSLPPPSLAAAEANLAPEKEDVISLAQPR
jgi:hypothetical protein